ncbi:MAG: MATE family efflux transporter [Methyloligellaceae bacterium]
MTSKLAVNEAALAKLEAARIAREKTTEELLTAPIKPTLIRLSAPNMLAMLISTITTIAEAIYAAKMGENALASLALVFPLFMFMHMLAAGAIGGAVASSVARALGAGNIDRADRFIPHALIIASVMAFLLAVLNAAYGSAFFSLLGGKGEVLAGAVEYAAVFFPGCIAIWLCHVLLSIIRGTGEMKMPSIVLVGISLGALPLLGALSLGWGPFPAMGMAGLALAPVAVSAIGGIVSIIYLASGKTGLSLRHMFSGLKVALFMDILRVGLVSCFGTMMTITSTIAVTGFVGQFGKDALAGFGLGTRLEFILLPLVFGVGAALTSMVGANIGGGNRERALLITWTGGIGVAIFFGVIGLVLALFPGIWLGLFLRPDQSEIWAAGAAYFHIVAPAYGFLVLGLSLSFASQGAGKVILPVTAATLRTILVLTTAYYMVSAFNAGVEGVFYAISAGMIIFGLLITASVKFTGWK